MAANTIDDVKTKSIPPVESDSEDDDSTAKDKKLYITELRQMCFDRILPRDLHTTQKSNAQVGYGMLRASGERRKLWHKKTLNVCFVQSHPHWHDEEILEVASTWSKYCGMTFTKVTSRYLSDIRIGFVEEEGAWSYVGTDCADIPLDETTMNLGFVDRSTILHEFGHAIGLIHEHQSPGEGAFEWNKNVVFKDCAGPPNFWDKDTVRSNILYRYKKSRISGTKYDKKSIMHYRYSTADC